MIILLSYRLGDDSKNNYFESYTDMNNFINKVLAVKKADYNSFEIIIYLGEEEKRVREHSEAFNE